MTCEIASSARKRDIGRVDPMSFFCSSEIVGEGSEFYTECHVSCPGHFYMVGHLLSP